MELWHFVFKGVADWVIPEDCNIFILANSPDPNEMWAWWAFHLGLHSLRKYLFNQKAKD